VAIRFPIYRFSVFNLRKKSLTRGTVVALASFWVSFRMSGFPEVHPCLWLLIPFGLTCLATFDSARCLQKRWTFYHGGVLLLLYCDLMVLLMISFFLLAPYSGTLL
jgi:hypothetical protein